MGVGRLEQAIKALPRDHIGEKDVRALREAAGSHVNDDEAKLLGKLLRDGDRFTRDGKAALEAIVKPARKESKAVEFKLKDSVKIDVKEPSGLTFISSKTGFITVSDQSEGISRLTTEGKSTSLRKASGDMKGLEGAAYDAEKGTLLVVSEDERTICEMKLEGDGKDLEVMKPKVLAKLPELGPGANKGWEGLAVLPASLSDDRKAHLIAVHEGSPRALAVLSRAGDVQATLKLPDVVKDALADISDVAIDPKTGHVFLLSDESETIFELRLTCSQKAGRHDAKWELEPLGKTKLPVQEGRGRLQAEGLAFDDKGDLWVVAEGPKALLHLERD